MNRTIFTNLLLFFLLTSCNPTSQDIKELNKLLKEVEKLVNEKESKEPLSFKKGEEYTVKVVGVADGDTFTGLTEDNQQIKCRIYGIDAPEKKQAFGNRSKQTLSDLIFGEEVQIKIQNKDRYGRAVVWVVFNGKDVSAEMLKAGMAWHYKQYSKDKDYAELEEQARQKKIGLWADKEPVAPWEFRRKK